MKFSLIRLSPGPSNAHIPQCQCVGERPKRHHFGLDLATKRWTGEWHHSKRAALPIVSLSVKLG